jgi:hypothetical protein
MKLKIATTSSCSLLQINTHPVPIASRQSLLLIERMTPTRVQGCKMMLIIIVLLTLTVFCRRRFWLHCGREFALLAQLLAEKVEADRNWDHGRSKTTEERACPLNAKVVEHLAGKEGEAGSDHGA